jgi:hypothetical protein
VDALTSLIIGMLPGNETVDQCFDVHLSSVFPAESIRASDGTFAGKGLSLGTVSTLVEMPPGLRNFLYRWGFLSMLCHFMSPIYASSPCKYQPDNLHPRMF